MSEQWTIHRVAHTDSTNTALKRMAAEGAPDGTVLIADMQSGGHGRMGRVFHSPSGGLYMSVLRRCTVAEGTSPLWTVAAAVAAAEGCEALCGCPIGVKWVNDLYLHGRKVCGILAEAVTDPESGEIALVMGFGVNIMPPCDGFPPDIADTAGALCMHAPDDARDRLAAHVLARFADYTKDLSARTFLEGYRARLLLRGKRITYLQNGEEHTAVAEDVDENGGLIVTEEGARRVLTAGEVTMHIEKL